MSIYGPNALTNVLLILLMIPNFVSLESKNSDNMDDQYLEPLSPYKFNQRMGQNLAYGDILLPPKVRRWHRFKGTKHMALKERPNNRWPDNEIPFVFSAKFSDRQYCLFKDWTNNWDIDHMVKKYVIREALTVLEDSSCFRFVPRGAQRDFLFIDMREGCFSFVGKIGGRQLLSLAAGCLHDYIIWHEVMHALGLEHEHQRPDRDKFIRIHWENVEPNKEVNFEKIPYADVDLYHTYDYYSLMHYDGTAFGKVDEDTGEPMITMEPLKKGVKLKDNFELTDLDIEKLQILSNCDVKRQKLRPGGLEAQLITDPGSVEDTEVSCTDRSKNCRTLKQRGYCAEIRYLRLIRIQCQNTCGFCGHDEEEEERAKKKKKILPLMSSEEEDPNRRVDAHYSRWTFPRKRQRHYLEGEPVEWNWQDDLR